MECTYSIYVTKKQNKKNVVYSVQILKVLLPVYIYGTAITPITQIKHNLIQKERGKYASTL